MSFPSEYVEQTEEVGKLVWGLYLNNPAAPSLDPLPLWDVLREAWADVTPTHPLLDEETPLTWHQWNAAIAWAKAQIGHRHDWPRIGVVVAMADLENPAAREALTRALAGEFTP